MQVTQQPTVSKVYSSSGDRLHTCTTVMGDYKTGSVKTIYGFVHVYAQHDYYSIEFIWNGKLHQICSKCENLASNRALTIRAARFARSVVRGNLNQLMS